MGQNNSPQLQVLCWVLLFRMPVSTIRNWVGLLHLFWRQMFRDSVRKQTCLSQSRLLEKLDRFGLPDDIWGWLCSPKSLLRSDCLGLLLDPWPHSLKGTPSTWSCWFQTSLRFISWTVALGNAVTDSLFVTRRGSGSSISVEITLQSWYAISLQSPCNLRHEYIVPNSVSTQRKVRLERERLRLHA